MKERPILFSAPMVRAILAGSKSQTRRIVKPQPLPYGPRNVPYPDFAFHRCAGVATISNKPGGPDGWAQEFCPYGQTGDRLWVKETYCFGHGYDGLRPREVVKSPHAIIRYAADHALRTVDGRQVNSPDAILSGQTRPSIHMPRWCSRITLEITDVRVQRLQEISEEDAKAEGVKASDAAIVMRDSKWHHELSNTARGAYAVLWESLNGAGSWDANPWVWCIGFKGVAP